MEIDWGIDVGAMAEDDGAEDGSGKGAAVAIDWEIDAVTDGTEGDGTGGEQQPVIEIDWDFAMDVEKCLRQSCRGSLPLLDDMEVMVTMLLKKHSCDHVDDVGRG